MPRDLNTFLLLGVGGMGMAPLALYLLQSGKTVYGYDAAPRPEVRALLEAQGLRVCEPAGLSEDLDAVVHTAAIPSDHPLLEAARKQGLPVYRRGEFLAHLAQKKRLIAVVGSHGKTTTTALALTLVESLGLPWEYLLGGFFPFSQKRLPARYTGSPWLLAEIDESDGTIEGFHPTYTLLLNADWDHPSQYHTAQDLQACLGRLIERTQEGLLIPSTDATLLQLAREHVHCTCKTFGPNSSDYSYEATPQGPQGQTLTILSPQHGQQHFFLPMTGAFNAFNAAAALGLISWAAQAQVPEDAFLSFPGLERRQHRLFASEALTVYSDYAHHPTELEAFLSTAQATYPEKTLWVLFEPHRYTRTKAYFDAFVQLFKQLPRLGLLDVYAASEPPLPGGDTPALLKCLPQAHYLPTPEAVLAYLKNIPKQPGSHLVLLTGAGLIDRMAQPWLDSLSPLVQTP